MRVNKPMQFIQLEGKHIQLEPLNYSHFSELREAAKDETLWTYHTQGKEFDKWFNKACDTPKNLSFIVRHLSNHKIIGSTRYYNIDLENKRLSIGYTWYIPETWGTYVNPECKYLLLTHAFETLLLNRVEFNVDSRNARSRAAMTKLGAKEEGLLRQHLILEDGYVRDTVVFSIIKSEWTDIKLKIESRLMP